MQDDNGETPLHWAASSGHDEIVKILLDVGADPTIRRKDGASALHCAASNGSEKSVRRLLFPEIDENAPKAAVNAPDNNGDTALHLAAWHGHDGVVLALLAVGAESSAQNKYTRTALDYARDWKHESIVKILQHADEEALHRAASDGNAELVEKLLRNGADVFQRSKDGDTAMHRAAAYGHTTVVELLAVGSGIMEVRSKLGSTALHKAAYGGHEAVVNILLQLGANIQAIRPDGWTPLHFAAQYGHLKAMNLLVDGTKPYLDPVHLPHLSSTEHLSTCSTNAVKLLKCLVLVYSQDPLIRRGLANEYFRRKMYAEASESFDIYVAIAMHNSGATEISHIDHRGYCCDDCGFTLRGRIYKCTRCGWLKDYCESCFAKHLHPIQDALKIPSETFDINKSMG
jgi:ankyrin repeat protein